MDDRTRPPDPGSDGAPAPPLACADARGLISAATDDELPGLSEQRLEGHLAGCPACRIYVDRVAALARSTRVRAVAPSGDLVGRVLDRSRPVRLGRGGWLRPALAWCAVVVAVQSVGPLVLGSVEGAPTHLARHRGAFALALAIALLYAAWRPHRAAGMMPFVGALLITTLASAVLDTATGTRSATAEVVHLSEVVGMVLLWLVSGSPGWDRVHDGLHRRRTDRSHVRRGVARSTS